MGLVFSNDSGKSGGLLSRPAYRATTVFASADLGPRVLSSYLTLTPMKEREWRERNGTGRMNDMQSASKSSEDQIDPKRRDGMLVKFGVFIREWEQNERSCHSYSTVDQNQRQSAYLLFHQESGPRAPIR